MTGLDDAGRGSLERLISRARRILEDDLSSVAEGRLGIHRDGTIEDEEALRLTVSDLAGRREVAAVVAHLRNEGETPGAAVERLIREASFTHLNRLVAIRVAESIGILPPSLAEGKSSRGFREVLELAPLLGSDPYGGYWSYLRLCGDELAADAPILFDPRNPLLTLAPSPSAVDELLSLFSEPALGNVWQAPDTLGWTYQFFNTSDERRQMRESGAPRNSRELAVRNQFFTPQYVVDFLVQNSLGRRLVEADPDAGLVEDLPLLVDPPTNSSQPLRLEDVLVLDPACGSGHFLLGAYDVLEKAWARVGIRPSEAAPRILLCLHGVDIDPRCAQLASAALMLRARRVCPKGDLPRPNMVTARALPRDTDAWQRVLSALPLDRQRLVRVLHETLGQAPALGSLLKVEDRLAVEIKRLAPEAESDRGTLGELWHRANTLLDAESDVLGALQRLADEASSSAAERLLAAEAGDAIRFVEAMRRRYDVVLMNPPFGEAIPATKEYLKAAYPSSKDNLFATFVARGLELCRPGGYVGAITSRAGMFLTSFERWRKEVLLGHRLVVLADLGYGVMEQAMVEAAAYVVGEHRATEADATFIRLLKERNRPLSLVEAIHESRTGDDARVFRVRASEFEAIPGAPIAYWVAAAIRHLFTSLKPLEGNGAEVRAGLCTGDDFRFIRCFWEIPPAWIGRSHEETLNGKRWVPFAKGGEYSPLWADLHLVVSWHRDGESIRGAQMPGTRVQNAAYYFRPGITWPLRTASGFGPRALPCGNIFGHKGPAVLPLAGVPIELVLAWLTSRIATACIAAQVAAGEETTSGSAAKSYEVGLVQRLPWPTEFPQQLPALQLGQLTSGLIRLRMARDIEDETARRFVAPAPAARGGILEAARTKIAAREDEAIVTIAESRQLETRLHELIALDDEAERYLDAEVGSHPDTLPRRPLEADGRFKRWYELPIEKVIDEVVAEQGGARNIVNLAYVADRRLEVLARALQCHPSVIAEERKKLRLLPPDEPKASAEELVSYLVGVAFGRWDIRIGRDQSLAPPAAGIFDPVPVCPPGMLVGQDGLPAHSSPSDYPLELPPDHLLLEEPGNRWDMEAALRRAAEVLLADADAVLDELKGILGRPLRDYLRRQFFKDHLSRYSKSRRQAPICWQLSVPSRTWSVWVYAPVLSRETLFAIARHAARRQATGREILGALQADRAAGGRGRSQRDLAARIAEEEDLASELEAFRAEAERVASLGWEPDLDDGLVLCAAPLSGLFPAWPAAAEELANLKARRYEWANVARWSDSL